VIEPTSLDELIEHHAIQQVLYRYATGIDTLDYDLIDDVFGADGVIDYTGFEGPKAPWTEVKSWAAESLAAFPLRKHYITNVVVEFGAGLETASCTSYWRAPVGAIDPDTGAPTFFESGGRYVDALERGPGGWRIRERVVHPDWSIGDLPGTGD
jgi:SnoaL-like domain